MRICAVVLVAMLASASCSLVFQDADPSQGEQCLGVQRTFERGASTIENRYSRIDYRQGTLTFWVQALKPIEGATSLVNLAGIAAVAYADGISLVVEGVGITSVEIPKPLWEVGTKHFVALRWDTNHPLSGADGSHMELRMDGQVYYSDIPDAFTVFPKGDNEGVLLIGDAQGRVHIDQVVIYDRPLFVDGNSAQKDSELDLLNDRRVSPRIADGGFDVLFATVSPGVSGCEDYAAEAWAFADNALLQGGNLKLAAGSVPFEALPPSLPEAQQVYPGGGIQVDADGEARISVDVDEYESYVLEILTHSFASGEGVPLVDVEFVKTAFPIIHHQAFAGTREDPRRSIVTFQAPAEETGVVIRLGAVGGTVAFDSMTLRPNLLVEAGFEEQEIVGDDSWSLDDAGGTIMKSDLTNLTETKPYAGETSICLTSPGSPAVILQEPKSRNTDQALMDDNALYLFGAQLLWRDRDDAPPSVNIGNGSLFATGGPYDRSTKAGTTVVREGQWENASSVGRRFLDKELNSQNDIIRFGTGYNKGPSNFCLDSAYNIKLEHIVQSNGTGLDR